LPTLAEARILRIIPKAGMTPAQMARSVGVTTPNISHLVTSLHRKGLVHRAPHPTDGRSSVYFRIEDEIDLTPYQERKLTPVGQRVLAHILKNPGLSIAAVARGTAGDPAHASRMVSVLESMGFVRIDRPNATKAIVHPTKKGRAYVNGKARI